MTPAHSLGGRLRVHALAEAVLPLAPRLPFASFSVDALDAAAALTSAFPEKRGILSHVVRTYLGEARPPCSAGVTIEAHFDATAIPAALGDRLLTLGFEPDGFARFVPAHFADHFTLKFKVAGNDHARRRALRAEAEDRCAALTAEVAADWPDLEAYLELEIYSEKSRRRWTPSPLSPGWQADLPFAPGALAGILPPCTASQAMRLGLPLGIGKQADIHLKIARATPAAERAKLIATLEDIGFYTVLTWADNDVCTAQFARGRDARRCFTALTKLFAAHGGCTELTLEPVARVWRSRDLATGRLGALPPLVLSIVDDAKMLSAGLQTA